MRKTSSRWFYSSVLVIGFLCQTPAKANNSFCKSWSDSEFAEDANQSPEFLNYITAPERLDADLEYSERSPDKPKVDQIFKFDSPNNIRCKKLAVKNDKISVREAVTRYTQALAKFRGCDENELKELITNQRKRFEQNKKTARNTPGGEKRHAIAPSIVHRLNWASEYAEKTEGRIFPFVSGPSTGDETFGTAVFHLKGADGKLVTKRVPISAAGNMDFCEKIPAIERRLNALFEQEQNRLLAKKSDDGTAECLAWFSANKEFNGRPAGTGLMSYLKVEPVSPSKFNFDKEYSTVEESEVAGSKLKKLTLKPYQSVDSISLVRDENDHLVTAEISTSGVRKSRFGNDLFFNKIVDFDYSSGRCQPQTIEYSETSGKFKITNQTCRQIEGGSVSDLAKVEQDAKKFVAAYRKAARSPADNKSNKTDVSGRELVRNFCSTFESYLE